MEGQGLGRGTEGGWRDADWVEGQGVDGGGAGDGLRDRGRMDEQEGA